MNRILAILVIIICSALSCSENKSATTKEENKTDTKNANLETSDTVSSTNYANEENEVTRVKDFDLFWIRDLEENTNKKVGFISLSDIYPLSEEPDSSAIPNLENVAKENQEFFKLNPSYRKRFLSKTNISETDSFFRLSVHRLYQFKKQYIH